jgi:hypothetical protein
MSNEKQNKKNSFSIEKLIIHKVDHHNYNDVILSDLETPIPDDKVANFLKQHIMSSRDHKYTRIANFSNRNKKQEKSNSEKEEEEADFKQICDDLMKKPSQFIPQSQVIAKHLFEVVKKKKSISASDLVICTFRDAPESPIQLALLKMDPEYSYVGERIIDENNKAQIILKRIEDVLPRGGLQKCAFIFPPDQRKKKKYDLKVLDLQQKRFGLRKPLASFFTKRFLQCYIPSTPDDYTYTFLDESYEWVEKKKPHWSPEKIDGFKQKVTESVRTDSINIADFAQRTIDSLEEQEEYVDQMKAKGLEVLIFQPAPVVRQSMTEYLCFEGDNGLKVRIKADDVGIPGSDKMLESYRDEATGYTIVTIRTVTWNMNIARGGRC